MELSSWFVVAGAIMFVIPEPITSVLGVLTALVGAVLRYGFGI
ncbi:hypothetical protein [Haloarchaeobius sp. HME9146]|nr:hypothetical protein [Haloarchaeobius sp. HME9146]MCT9096816.1 hypothetical protein [Haloarchaeobius sp. HME9146]